MRLTRRTVLGGLASATALSAPMILRAQGARELVMIGYGNDQDLPLIRAGEELGRRHPGVTLTVLGGLSTEALAQIRAARGNSPYDLAVMGSPAIVNALDEEVLEPMDLSLIPNAANIDPMFTPLAYGAGCPITFEGIGFAYNADAIENPPATWEELWNPEFAGRVGMCRPQSNLGLGVLAATSAAFGNPETDMEFALNKWMELDPLVGRSPPLLQQMLERGEIDITPLWHVNSALAAAAGLSIGYVKVQNPGPLMLPSNVVHFVNTQDGTRELVHEFADIMLEAELQQYAGSAPIYFGTVVEGIETSEDAAPFVPATAEERAAMSSLDWQAIAPLRGSTVDTFDRMFAG
jgi:putative spermidine/putrescine transport system substrate-binding protein